MSESDQLEAPKPGGGDAVHALARAMVAAVPGAGGPAAELFSLVVAPPVQKRTEAWMASVAREIRRQGLVLEELAGNDRLSALVWQGLHVAARTHQQKKLAALQHVVVNAATGKAPSSDETPALFLRYIDELTPSHLALLAFLAEHEEEARMNQGYEDLFQLAAPACGEVTREFFKLICEDLSARSLIRLSRDLADFPGMFAHNRMLMEEDEEGPMLSVTALGRGFLRFISEPGGRA